MSESLQLVCPHCNTLNRAEANRLTEGPICGKCKKAIFTGQPLELTQQNFDVQIGNSDLPVLVDFWAPWCGPCRMMTPTIEQAAKELQYRFRIAKLNTETEGSVAAPYGIRSIPSLLVFHRGREIGRQTGMMDYTRLSAWLESVVSSSAQP